MPGESGEVWEIQRAPADGIAVQAAAGCAREDQLRVAETALRAWPAPASRRGGPKP
ncbi:hypothetical protein [Streptosporangium vulgare]|uniref:Uncharacterized protein n=1 Tax=Streptosporangium vulgare TaxID=46190 RepID=A0ABV5TIY3_9ACTN